MCVVFRDLFSVTTRAPHFILVCLFWRAPRSFSRTLGPTNLWKIAQRLLREPGSALAQFKQGSLECACRLHFPPSLSRAHERRFLLLDIFPLAHIHPPFTHQHKHRHKKGNKDHNGGGPEQRRPKKEGAEHGHFAQVRFFGGLSLPSLFRPCPVFTPFPPSLLPSVAGDLIRSADIVINSSRKSTYALDAAKTSKAQRLLCS